MARLLACRTNHIKMYVCSKERMFEKARGRRNSHGFIKLQIHGPLELPIFSNLPPHTAPAPASATLTSTRWLRCSPICLHLEPRATPQIGCSLLPAGERKSCSDWRGCPQRWPLPTTFALFLWWPRLFFLPGIGAADPRPARAAHLWQLAAIYSFPRCCVDLHKRHRRFCAICYHLVKGKAAPICEDAHQGGLS